jgi:hypothetical protein
MKFPFIRRKFSDFAMSQTAEMRTKYNDLKKYTKDVVEVLSAGTGVLDQRRRPQRQKNRNARLSDQLKTADRYSVETLAGDLIDSLVDSAVLGFAIEGTENADLTEGFFKFNTQWGMQSIIKKMFKKYKSQNGFIFYWNDVGGLNQIGLLPITDCNILPGKGSVALGYPFSDYYISQKPDVVTKDIGLNAKNSDNPGAKKLYDHIKKNKELYAAVTEAKRYSLNEKNGDHFIVIQNGPLGYERGQNGIGVWPIPGMIRIFPDIELIEQLAEGHSQVAYFLKTMIRVINAGKQIQGASKNEGKLSEAERQSINNQFTTLAQSLGIVGDATLKVSYPHPDMNIFDPLVFAAALDRILLHYGLSLSFLIGAASNSSFAQATVGFRNFYARISGMRADINQCLYLFYTHPSIRKLIEPGKIESVLDFKFYYETDFMKEMAIVKQDKQLSADYGYSGWETMSRRTGNHPEFEKKRIKNFDIKKENQKIVFPRFEKNTGISAKVEGLSPAKGESGGEGRPPGDAKGDTKPTATNEPKASVKSSDKDIHSDMVNYSDTDLVQEVKSPFTSLKQLLHLRINYPEIYKKWVKKYGIPKNIQEQLDKK